MIIGSVSENKEIEKRIAITPDKAKRYINFGFEVQLIKNYGLHLGFNANQYTDLGTKIMKIKSSLKSLKKRDLNSKLVRRRGRVYIINKKNPKFKARQK